MSNVVKKAAKSKTKKRGRLKKLVWFGFVASSAVMLVAGAAWATANGLKKAAAYDLFAVGSVRISGLKYVKQADLLEYVGDPGGESVFMVDMDGMARRLAAHPWIKWANVRRELPDALRLDICERVPAALAVTADGSFLVDGDGWTLASVRGSEWDFLPSFVYERERTLAVGGGSADYILPALELIDTIRGEKTELLAGAVVFVGTDGLPLIRYGGADVLFGKGPYNEKATRLTDVLPDLSRRGIAPKVIDLRFPGKVVVDGDGLTGSGLG